jgi:hypothetical protein
MAGGALRMFMVSTVGQPRPALCGAQVLLYCACCNVLQARETECKKILDFRFSIHLIFLNASIGLSFLRMPRPFSFSPFVSLAAGFLLQFFAGF